MASKTFAVRVHTHTHTHTHTRRHSPPLEQLLAPLHSLSVFCLLLPAAPSQVPQFRLRVSVIAAQSPTSSFDFYSPVSPHDLDISTLALQDPPDAYPPTTIAL